MKDFENLYNQQIPQPHNSPRNDSRRYWRWREYYYKLTHDYWLWFWQVNPRAWWWEKSTVAHPFPASLAAKCCYVLATTMANSMMTLRKYYHLRETYYDNMEYEIGYLTHQITQKYRDILELYHMVKTRYARNDTNILPLPLMYFLYQNIVSLSKSTIHLCNMLHEVPLKYEGKRKSIFDDYHIPDAVKALDLMRSTHNVNTDVDEVKQGMEKKQEELLAKKEDRLDERLDILLGGLGTTVNMRMPTASGRWPIVYGWSIEEW